MENTVKPQSKKLNNISLLRFLMCISIFVYHYLSFFVTPTMTYWMPSPILVFVFALLSAFLYSSKTIDNPKDWIKKNFLKLLIPTVVYVLLACTLLIVVGMFVYSFDFGQVFANFTGENPSGGGINFVFGNLWFLGMLMLCYIATPFCYRFASKQYSKKGSILFLAIIIAICVVEIMFNFFCPVFTVYIASYFVGRIVFKAACQEEPKKEHWPMLVISAVALIGAILVWYLWIGKVPHTYLDFHIKALKYFVCFTFSLSFSILFLYAFKFMNAFNMPLFKYTDKYSFPFYMAHQLYMVGTLCFYHLIPSWYFVPLFFLALATAIIVDLLASLVIKKVLPAKKTA